MTYEKNENTLIADPRRLDEALTIPYQIVLEAVIRDEYHTWSELQKNICALFTSKMRAYANKKVKYRSFVLKLNEKALLALEGKKVSTTTTTENFNFNLVFEGIDRLSQGKISKNKIQHGQLTLYPVRNFPTDLKKHVIYRMLSDVNPFLLAGIMKYELPLYIAEDFQLAVGCDFWDHEDLCDCIGSHRQFNYYQFSPTFKLYVLDKCLDRSECVV